METLKIPKDFQNLQMCIFRDDIPKVGQPAPRIFTLTLPWITFTLCGRKPLNSLDINF